MAGVLQTRVSVEGVLGWLRLPSRRAGPGRRSCRVPRARTSGGSGVGQGDVSGVTCVVSAHTHTDVALGEGKRQGGLWLAAGPEPEFPLWLGLISLPLTFLGDPCWFPPHQHTLVLEPRRREIPQAGGWGEGAGQEQALADSARSAGFLAFPLSIPIRSSDRHTQYSLPTKPCANYSVLPTIPPSMGSVAFAIVLLAEREAQRESIEVTRSASAPTFSTSLSGTQSPLVRSSPPGIQSVAKLPGKNLRGSLALWSWGDHSLLWGCQASKRGLGEGKERSSWPMLPVPGRRPPLALTQHRASLRR